MEIREGPRVSRCALRVQLRADRPLALHSLSGQLGRVASRLNLLAHCSFARFVVGAKSCNANERAVECCASDAFERLAPV